MNGCLISFGIYPAHISRQNITKLYLHPMHDFSVINDMHLLYFKYMYFSQIDMNMWNCVIDNLCLPDILTLFSQCYQDYKFHDIFLFFFLIWHFFYIQYFNASLFVSWIFMPILRGKLQTYFLNYLLHDHNLISADIPSLGIIFIYCQYLHLILF